MFPWREDGRGADRRGLAGGVFLHELLGERGEEAFEKGQEGQGLARGLAGTVPARTFGGELRIRRQNIFAKSLCCRVVPLR